MKDEVMFSSNTMASAHHLVIVGGLCFDLLLTLLTALQPHRSMLNLLEQISIKAVCNGEPCICCDLRCKYRLVLMPLLALDPLWPGVEAIINLR